jgi:hypothetical protein
MNFGRHRAHGRHPVSLRSAATKPPSTDYPSSACAVNGEDTRRAGFPIRSDPAPTVAAAMPDRTRRFPARPCQDPSSRFVTKLAISGQPLMAATGQIPMAANSLVRIGRRELVFVPTVETLHGPRLCCPTHRRVDSGRYRLSTDAAMTSLASGVHHHGSLRRDTIRDAKWSQPGVEEAPGAVGGVTPAAWSWPEYAGRRALIIPWSNPIARRTRAGRRSGP